MTKRDFNLFTMLDLIVRSHLILISIFITVAGVVSIIISMNAFSFFVLGAGLFLLLAGIMAYKQKLRKVRGE